MTPVTATEHSTAAHSILVPPATTRLSRPLCKEDDGGLRFREVLWEKILRWVYSFLESLARSEMNALLIVKFTSFVPSGSIWVIKAHSYYDKMKTIKRVESTHYSSYNDESKAILMLLRLTYCTYCCYKVRSIPQTIYIIIMPLFPLHTPCHTPNKPSQLPPSQKLKKWVKFTYPFSQRSNPTLWLHQKRIFFMCQGK